MGLVHGFAFHYAAWSLRKILPLTVHDTETCKSGVARAVSQKFWGMKQGNNLAAAEWSVHHSQELDEKTRSPLGLADCQCLSQLNQDLLTLSLRSFDQFRIDINTCDAIRMELLSYLNSDQASVASDIQNSLCYPISTQALALGTS